MCIRDSAQGVRVHCVGFGSARGSKVAVEVAIETGAAKPKP